MNDRIATHEEVLELLTEQARAGSVTASAALARELRARPPEDEDQVGTAIDRILGKPGQQD